MDPELLNLVADHMTIVSYNRSEVIYQERQPAKGLFIIYEGTVQVTMLVDHEPETLQILQYEDFFGYEILSASGYRVTSAVALTNVVLLKFDEEQIAFLAESIPELGEALDLMLRSFQLILRLRFSWIDENEVILYLARRHPIFLIIRLVPVTIGALIVFLPLLLFDFTFPSSLTLLLSGLAALIFTFLYIWFIVDYLNDYSIVTNQRVVWQERIVFFYDSRTESPLTAIQSVTTDTSFLGRQFDFGDVVVKTYTGTIRLPQVWDPTQVQRIVEASWYRARERRTQAETDMIEHRVAEIVHEGKDLPPLPSAPSPPGSGAPAPVELNTPPPREQSALGRIFSNLFSLRFEFDGNIIYRKHWWILIINIWAPTLAALAVLIVGLAALLMPGVFLSPLIGAGILLIGGLISGGWWLYQYIDWRNDYFMVTDEQILDVYKKPLAQEERQVAPLRNILSIEFQRLGLIGLLLNFGTVYIRVGDTQLTFDEVFNPSEVQRDLFNRLADRLYKDRLAEVQREQQRIAQWLETYHRMSNGGQR